MAEPGHELRYADGESAYCICGGWHLWVPDYRVASQEHRMGLIEESFQRHASRGIWRVAAQLTDVGGG